MRFGRNLLFSGITVDLKTGTSLVILGPNGSGKTTLLNILSGLLKPSRGSVQFTINTSETGGDTVTRFIGYVGPALQLYDDLTGMENIYFACRHREHERIHELMERFSLYSERNKLVHHYSSGMKQRLKIISALINDPPVLAFDEPGTNLDDNGKEQLHSLITSVLSDRLLLIATNDREEAGLCSQELHLG